ncbi:PREDICTED: MATH and LRR domain-containing protein PFE0570w [Polistes dominula]|uniref:MATH and LRR domain-containing protein PFE0570w n=1 Tax=Polistes dominula TaxID=743375 RepID=A0ABM1J5T3_POLDO|nr:PREDICTED: MATH and LRR domain-containing protein PFE0570w [Polistes dominula]
METDYLNLQDCKLFPNLEITNEQNIINEDSLSNFIDNNLEPPSEHISIDDMWNLLEDSPNDLNVINNTMLNYDLDSNEIINKEDYNRTVNDWDEHLESLPDMDDDMNNVSKDTTLLGTNNSYLHLNDLEESNVEIISNMKIKIKGSGIADYKNNCVKNTSSENSQEDFNTKKKIQSENKTTATENKNRKRTYTETITTKGKKMKRNLYEEKEQEETDTCIDIVTVPEETPMLEAGDVNSLFEQFEASEIFSVNASCHNKVSKQSNQNIRAQPRKKKLPAHSKNTNSPVHSGNSNSPVYPKKPNSSPPNSIKDINDPASKEVIDRIKALNKETKKGISVIPAMPNLRKGGRNNSNRIQDITSTTLSKNKVVKVANKGKNKTINGGSIQLDHDYCSNSNFTVNDPDNSASEKKTSENSEKTLSTKNKSKKCNRPCAVKNRTTTVRQAKSFKESDKSNVHKNFIKDNSLESAKTSNNSEQFLPYNSNSNNTVEKQFNKQTKEHLINTQPLKQEIKPPSHESTPQKNAPMCVMKIQSAIVAKILRSKNKKLNNSAPIKDNKQMVSVLKKPPTVQPIVQPIATNNNESIVTTTNSSNNIVQNIIIENIEDIPKKIETKPPPRKKLNLAEYRNRRVNSNVTSKLAAQSMTIAYVYQASTTTEPFKDQLGNELWCERECIPEKISEADLNKLKAKPPTRDMETQTYETVFKYATKCLRDFDEKNEIPIKSLVDVDERNTMSTKSPIIINEENEVSTKSLMDVDKRNDERQQSKKHILDREEQQANKKRKLDSSSSRSRSRSYSTSRSRSPSPNRNEHHRDRSKNRSSRHNIRHKRINHRPSSVSSNVSCTSQSLSDIRSNSRSRYSFSHSESSRSRSTSMSDQYSPCSRSSPNSNDGSSKWHPENRSIKRNFAEVSRNGDRYNGMPSKNSHNNKNGRSSSSNNYQRSYGRYSEKKSNEYRQNVIYAGCLESGATKATLYQRFRRFGSIETVSIHHREQHPWDCYGFITFYYKHDAFKALEHGNDDPNLPKYELNFGHRRDFCEIPYEDLDHYREDEETKYQDDEEEEEEETFDSLLKKAKANIGKRKV